MDWLVKSRSWTTVRPSAEAGAAPAAGWQGSSEPLLTLWTSTPLLPDIYRHSPRAAERTRDEDVARWSRQATLHRTAPLLRQSRGRALQDEQPDQPTEPSSAYEVLVPL